MSMWWQQQPVKSHRQDTGSEILVIHCPTFLCQFIYGEDGLEVSKTPFLQEQQMPFLLKNQHVISGLEEPAKGEKHIEKHKKKVSTASVGVPWHDTMDRRKYSTGLEGTVPLY